VLQDGDQVVHDSWAIAEHLEGKYPAKPLFDSAQAKSLALDLHGGLARKAKGYEVWT
jgi:glutathione S-transferase